MRSRWLMHARSVLVALGGAIGILAFSSGSAATPVLAASALVTHTMPAPPLSAQAQLQALVAKSLSYTPAQLASATAYLKAHPFQGSIQYIPSATPTAPGGIRPDASVYVYWWGVRIHLTNADVVSLFSAIVTYGAAAVAAALCAPGVWAMVVCGLIGAIVGWIIVTVVLQATNNFGGCNLNIDIPWAYRYWHWYCT